MCTPGFHFNRKFAELPQLPHRIGDLIVSPAAAKAKRTGLKRSPNNRPTPSTLTGKARKNIYLYTSSGKMKEKIARELRPQIKSKRHRTQLTKYPWLWRNDSSRTSPSPVRPRPTSFLPSLRPGSRGHFLVGAGVPVPLSARALWHRAHTLNSKQAQEIF